VNYKISAERQLWVHLRKVHNVHGPTLWHGWHGFELRIVNNATDEWCKRLLVCVYVKGPFFRIFSSTADYTYQIKSNFICKHSNLYEEKADRCTFLEHGRIACNAERCNSYGNSVRLSARPSVTRWYPIETNEGRIMRSLR